MDLARTSASRMARAIKDGEVGAGRALAAHAARIGDLNPELNAIVLPRLAEAREEANPFLAFYYSVNLVYGATHNPHDGTRSAGGSSGGEGAAIAAAMSPAGFGSDLGSSIRQPAHFNGVFGMSPSRGVVPLAPATDRARPPLGFERCCTVGPLARTADDIELLLRVAASRPLAGATEPRRATVYEEDGLQPWRGPAGRRFAAPRTRWRRGLGAQRGAPARRRGDPRRLRRPHLPGTGDGARFGGAGAGGGAVRPRPARGGRPGDDRALLRGYLTASKRLVELKACADAWLERHELALCPVAPGPAPELGVGFTEIDGEPPRPGGLMTLATYANALGLPSVSVPALRTNDGLPVGVLVTGRRERDLEVIAAARELERLLGGYIAPLC